MNCGEDVGVIISVVKTFYNVVKFVLPIYMIVTLTIDVAKIIISKKEDDAKKIRNGIFRKMVYCIAIFLIPTFVFFAFDTFFGNTIYNVHDVRACWYN